MVVKGAIAGVMLAVIGIVIFEITGGGFAFVVALMLTVAVGWLVLAYYLSKHADPRMAGLGFIVRGIEKRGENPKQVPASLLDNEVEEAIYFANLKSGVTWENSAHRARWNAEFLDELDTRAMLLAKYLSDPSHEFFKTDESGENYHVQKFKEHGL